MSPALLIHIAGGGLGIVSGAAAVAVRKGGRAHRGGGAVFTGSMLAMAAAAAVLALSLPDWANLPGALFAAYLVVTGATAFDREGALRRSTEQVSLALAGGACACALLLTFQAHASPTGLINGKPAPIFAIVAGLSAFALVLDLRIAGSRGAARRPRLRRHIWRMCTALFFGTGSFFLGQQQTLPLWLQGSPVLFGLALAPLGFMAFWLARTVNLKPLPSAPA